MKLKRKTFDLNFIVALFVWGLFNCFNPIYAVTYYVTRNVKGIKIMKKIIFLVVMIQLFSVTVVAYDWEIEVVDPDLLNQNRHYLSLALDNSDHSHIAYYIGRLNGQPPSTIKYAYWNGTDWEISMVDQSNMTLFACETTSLALDDDGYPHISYTGDDGDSYCLKYALWTGTNWDLQIIDNSSGWVGEFNSLKLDSLGYAHISYYDNNGDYLKYASWNGQTWEIEIVSNGLAWGTSLDLDSLGYPCIAYYGDGHVLNYFHWNGTSWDFYNVDNFGGNVGSIDISLVLDSQDYPHIIYYMFDQTLRYARWDGSEWIITTVTGNYGGAYSWLALDSQDNPHIVYYQATGNTWNVWYKYWDGTCWHNEVVNQPLGGGWNCRIALDSQEHPRIAYFNQNTDDLEYAEPIIPAGNIDGIVTDFYSGDPIENAIVFIEGISDTTEFDGTYLLENVPVGLHDITCTAEGYDDLTVEDVAVLENQTVTVDFTLDPITGVDDIVPEVAGLLTNYPNPFNSTTTIFFNISRKDANNAKIEIYNIKGQKVKSLIIGNSSSDNNKKSVVWDGTNNKGEPVGSGIYFCRLNIDNKPISTKKIILLK